MLGASMLSMQPDFNQDAVSQRITRLNEVLLDVRRSMERLMAENQRMREVLRLAESELRKRRDEVQKLETEINSLQNSRLDAKARVEHAIEKLDELMTQSENNAG